MSPEQTHTNIGRVIHGRYRIVELLGRGGMAEVYKAYQENLDRYVAIKLMHGFLADDTEFLKRFQREAKNVAAMRHPNIVQVHDFDREGNDYYMVMEYIDGQTLKGKLEDLAEQQEKLSQREALRIVRDLGGALSYAHARNMIHRDIKPANIMLDSGGRVVLTDFGIAKIATGTQLTASGAMIGTPAFMAPEQGLGQPGDGRADIYSLGVVLYQLVTGRLPYEADTPLAIILMHVNDPLPTPSTVNPDIPLGLERIIMKALAKVPTERYQTVDEMVRHLNDMEAAAAQEIPHSTLVGVDAATIRGMPDQAAGATVLAGRGGPDATAVPAGATPIPQPVGDTLPAVRSRSLWWGIAAAVVVLALGTFGFLGVRGGLFAPPTATPTLTATETATSAPSETATVAGTPTLDIILQLTLDAAESVRVTNEALQTTPSDTPGPNLTATFEACKFEYDLVAQDPENDERLFVNQTVEIEVALENEGDCAWGEDTVLSFVDGAGPPEGDPEEIEVGAVDPGDSVTVKLPLRTPGSSDDISATWQLITSGKVVEPDKPLEFAFSVIVPATLPPPEPTSTETPAGPPPTVPGPITGANPTYHYCDYVTDTAEFDCLVTIGVGGGQEPFTIVIGPDVISCSPSANLPCTWHLVARRCASNTFFEIDVTDANGDRKVVPSGFDAKAFNIFPPDHRSPCTDKAGG